MRVGRERRYKIGKANIVEQRARQISVTLPEELELVHAITTDDAYGIEAYWHKRYRLRADIGDRLLGPHSELLRLQRYPSPTV